LAVEAGRPEIVELLLHLGADPKLKSRVSGGLLTAPEFARKTAIGAIVDVFESDKENGG
jgi:hypothetical protein